MLVANILASFFSIFQSASISTLLIVVSMGITGFTLLIALLSTGSPSKLDPVRTIAFIFPLPES